MTDFGRMRYFMGIEVIHSDMGIFICQRRYAREMLVRFNMTECNLVRNPIVSGTEDDEGTSVDATKFKQVVGSLMYLAVTRPDLMFGVSLISRYMANPKASHLAATKRILRYVKGTIEYGILYQKGGKTEITTYSDSHYTKDLDDRQSTYRAYCNTQEQVTDIMTKAAKLEKFDKLRQMLRVVDITTIKAYKNRALSIE
ncbi:uncharacterized protein LOC106766104 [Vigna radiata var. radiata]|uniref:Uncharacterized protein LOC106766104 n=1 Tax=Vigna radiata var. radiata TaxID=3916 RepID=A0A1S3UK87_VIGRR|nr:uncharacterized protein LOC106766104 [Vigna radiata var. radiata]